MQEQETGSKESLLEPSLRDDGPRVSIYSAGASLFVAFFGGPVAASLFINLNSKRLGRLKQDLWLPMVSIAALAVIYYLLFTPQEGVGLVAMMGERAVRQKMRLLPRALALAVFCIGYLMHRRAYKSMEFLGLEPPNPWKPGLLCGFIGFVVQIAVFAIVYQVRLAL